MALRPVATGRLEGAGVDGSKFAVAVAPIVTFTVTSAGPCGLTFVATRPWEVADPCGTPAPARQPVTLVDTTTGADRTAEADVAWNAQHETVDEPVVEELWVKHLLDRDEFRALCDAKKTRAAIVEALRK